MEEEDDGQGTWSNIEPKQRTYVLVDKRGKKDGKGIYPVSSLSSPTGNQILLLCAHTNPTSGMESCAELEGKASSMVSCQLRNSGGTRCRRPPHVLPSISEFIMVPGLEWDFFSFHSAPALHDFLVSTPVCASKSTSCPRMSHPSIHLHPPIPNLYWSPSLNRTLDCPSHDLHYAVHMSIIHVSEDRSTWERQRRGDIGEPPTPRAMRRSQVRPHHGMLMGRYRLKRPNIYMILT